MKLIISNYNRLDTANIFISQDEESNPLIQVQISKLKEIYSEIAVFTSGSKTAKHVIHQILKIKPSEDTSNDF